MLTENTVFIYLYLCYVLIYNNIIYLYSLHARVHYIRVYIILYMRIRGEIFSNDFNFNYENNGKRLLVRLLRFTHNNKI